MRRPRRVSRHLARQPFGTRRAARCPSLRTRQGPLPSRTTRRATTWFPPRRVLPGRRALSAPRRPPWPSVVRFPPARYHEVGVPVPMRRRPPMLLRCSEALAQLLFAAFTRRALRPGNVASGDRCVRGTLAPRHHAGTNNLLSKAPGATGRKAALAPRHYRIPACSHGTPHRECDVPRRGRPAVTGRCASDRPPDEHRHGAHHRLVGAGRRHAGPAGVRRPRDAPAALDGHPPHQRRAAGTFRPRRHIVADSFLLTAMRLCASMELRNFPQRGPQQ